MKDNFLSLVKCNKIKCRLSTEYELKLKVLLFSPSKPLKYENNITDIGAFPLKEENSRIVELWLWYIVSAIE